MPTNVREAIAQNLVRLRKSRGLSLRKLGAQVSQLGSDLTADAIHRIENQKRQTTVEELLALAAALDVSPATLLLPTEREPVQVAPKVHVEWEQAWRWLLGEQSAGGESDRDYIRENRPFERAAPVEIGRQLRVRVGEPFTAEFHYRPGDDHVVGSVTAYSPDRYRLPEALQS